MKTQATELELLEMVTDRLEEIVRGMQAVDRFDPHPKPIQGLAAMTAAATFAACGVIEAAGLGEEGDELALTIGREGLKAMVAAAQRVLALRS